MSENISQFPTLFNSHDFFFFETEFYCPSGWPGTLYVDHAGLELTDMPAFSSASQVLGLTVCITTPGFFTLTLLSKQKAHLFTGCGSWGQTGGKFRRQQELLSMDSCSSDFTLNLAVIFIWELNVSYRQIRDENDIFFWFSCSCLGCGSAGCAMIWWWSRVRGGRTASWCGQCGLFTELSGQGPVILSLGLVSPSPLLSTVFFSRGDLQEMKRYIWEKDARSGFSKCWFEYECLGKTM